MKKEKEKEKIEEEHALKLSKEYIDIVGEDDFIVVTQNEWNMEGDMFKKLSIYENYSPVETSGSTTLVRDL